MIIVAPVSASKMNPTWDVFAVYLLHNNGDICCLCPVVPTGWCVTVSDYVQTVIWSHTYPIRTVRCLRITSTICPDCYIASSIASTKYVIQTLITGRIAYLVFCLRRRRYDASVCTNGGSA